MIFSFYNFVLSLHVRRLVLADACNINVCSPPLDLFVSSYPRLSIVHASTPLDWTRCPIFSPYDSVFSIPVPVSLSFQIRAHVSNPPLPESPFLQCDAQDMRDCTLRHDFFTLSLLMVDVACIFDATGLCFLAHVGSCCM
jgi:hypothetical protein